MIKNLNSRIKILYIGGSGLLGRAISKIKKFKTLYSSTRNIKKYTKFNIFNENIKNIFNLSNFSHLTLSVNVNNIEKFENTKFRKNFTKKIIDILKEIKKYNIIPIFFSSDYVYNNNKNSEIYLNKPTNGYGIHKYQIEYYINKNFKKFIILRLGKVIHLKKNCFLYEWKKKIKNKKKILIYKNQFINPLYINDLVKIYFFLIKKKKFGTFNISNNEFLSRIEILNMLINKKKINEKKIKIVNFYDLKINKNRSPGIHMNTKKINKTFTGKFSSIKKLIGELNKSDTL